MPKDLEGPYLRVVGLLIVVAGDDVIGRGELKDPFVVVPGPGKNAKELSRILECGYECLPNQRDTITGKVEMGPLKRT